MAMRDSYFRGNIKKPTTVDCEKYRYFFNQNQHSYFRDSIVSTYAQAQADTCGFLE